MIELTESCQSGYPSYKTWYLAHIFSENKLNVLGRGKNGTWQVF